MIPIRRAEELILTSEQIGEWFCIIQPDISYICRIYVRAICKINTKPINFSLYFCFLPSKAPFDPDECFKRNLRGFRVAQVRGDRVDGQDRGNWYRELTERCQGALQGFFSNYRFWESMIFYVRLRECGVFSMFVWRFWTVCTWKMMLIIHVGYIFTPSGIWLWWFRGCKAEWKFRTKVTFLSFIEASRKS